MLLSEYGSGSARSSPVNRMMAAFAEDFRDGVDINLVVGYVNERTMPRDRIREALESELAQLFAHAQAQGWVLLRGGSVGPPTTANLLLRLKRANDNYYGANAPLRPPPDPPPHMRTGVPCYFDNLPQGTRWTEIENADHPTDYVASFQNLGNAAPQGVHCAGVEEVLDGSCLRRLEDYIEKPGGKYINPGHVPPPGW